MIKYLRSIKKRDPAARHFFQIILFYPGVHAFFWYKIAHFFFQIKLKLIAEMISFIVRMMTQIEIHPGALIGKRLFIDHGSGTVIGETTIIGDDCTIYQGVTLGSVILEKVKRHPTLGNRVIVGSGAKVIGNISIGDDAKIGAGAVVLNDVPPKGIAIGYKATIINKNNEQNKINV